MFGRGWRSRGAGGGSLDHPRGKPRSAGPGPRLAALGGSRALSELGKGAPVQRLLPGGKGLPSPQARGSQRRGGGGNAADPPLRGAPRGGLDPPPLLISSHLPTPQNTAPAPRRGNPSSGAMGRCKGVTPGWGALAAPTSSGGTRAAAPSQVCPGDQVGPLPREKLSGRRADVKARRPDRRVAARLLTPRAPSFQPGNPQLLKPPLPLYLPQLQEQLIETSGPALSQKRTRSLIC